MSLFEDLNACDAAGFAALLSGIYEHSPWVAERAQAWGPFHTLAQLKQALVQAVRQATRDEQLGLIRAHPELAGKAAVAGTLTAESTTEQGRAGLMHCSPAEFATPMMQENRSAASSSRFLKCFGSWVPSYEWISSLTSPSSSAKWIAACSKVRPSAG